MSLRSWKSQYLFLGVSTEDKILVRTTLRLWTGLKGENLERHGVRKSPFSNLLYSKESGDTLPISFSRIPLCIKHLYGEHSCKECPVYKHLGNKQCNEGEDSPYRIWLREGEPSKMLMALYAVTSKLNKEAQRNSTRKGGHV